MRVHGAVLEEIRTALGSAHGLSLEWYDVLVHLDEAPGRRLRMTQLARSLALSKSWLTRRIDQMERAGLVSREAVASDGRGAFAALTRRGVDVLRRADRTRARVVKERFDDPLPPRLERGLRAALLAISRANQSLEGTG